MLLTVLFLADALTQSIDAKVGDSIAVTLGENASTGYDWRLEASGTDLIASDGGTFAAPSALPGAAGRKTFTIRVLKPGATTLRFQLSRPWESRPPEATATLALTIR